MVTEEFTKCVRARAWFPCGGGAHDGSRQTERTYVLRPGMASLVTLRRSMTWRVPSA